MPSESRNEGVPLKGNGPQNVRLHHARESLWNAACTRPLLACAEMLFALHRAPIMDHSCRQLLIDQCNGTLRQNLEMQQVTTLGCLWAPSQKRSWKPQVDSCNAD
ncbi:hypothetical protein QAD02_014174 [Eretmocerus hayati]|uniref:Uncharacterized protein n=1 Tax=Eretmocerus hayati TaxID=131215 RepID=A0ACC2P7E2_9HYME|nr:hypothetical protein QAD02_014174 [Eretmocerus hayati]